MVTKLRANIRQFFSTPEFHAAARSGLVHLILILAIALLFFGVESLIEQFVANNDAVADVITAVASTFLFFWIRAAFENARLLETLRAQSEERAAALTTQMKFLADVAHEFQTPIAILKCNVAILAKPFRGESRSGMRERANAAGVTTTTLDRLSRLVTNLLDIAKLDFQKDTLDKESIDVRILAEEACEDCAILAEDKKITLSFAAARGGDTADDARAFVLGNKDKLKEVLLNLISNALKYTPAGGTISIEARRISRNGDNGGGEAEIVVADTGRGIAPENLPHIFERFYRIENQGGSVRPSSARDLIAASNGLGLHICRKIVEAHGGTITAESELGRGSRFIVHLPLATSAPAIHPSPTAARPGSGIINP